MQAEQGQVTAGSWVAKWIAKMPGVPLLCCLLVGLAMLLVACTSTPNNPADSGAPPAQNKLTVVATTGQLADAVEQVGGEAIETINLLGPGIDPHTYVPTESDIEKLQAADIIIYNGIHLEVRIEEALEQIGQISDITVVAPGDRIGTARLLEWEPESGLPYDPHIWNDVTLWMEVVRTIRDTLAEADPDNAADYTTRADTYLAELETLHRYIQEKVRTIPPDNRILVTAHDAFGYFGRAYGLTVYAVQGISTETEASPADIQAVADMVVETGVPAIFVETMISPRAVEAVQAAVQARRGERVAIGGELYSDTLGPPVSAADSYTSMMRYNIDTIAAALGGSTKHP